MIDERHAPTGEDGGTRTADAPAGAVTPSRVRRRRRPIAMIASAVVVALVVSVAVTSGPSTPTALADVIIIPGTDPDLECDPDDFPGLPFDPCPVLGGGGGGTPVDDPLNPCDGLIISGERRNSREVVVQRFHLTDPDTGETVLNGPICILEQVVIAELAADRGVELNAEERAEILAFGRDEIRTRLHVKLVAIQERVNEGETVSALEAGALRWAQTLTKLTEIAIAQAAVDEHATWKAAPCFYEPPEPHQYVPDFDPGCTGGLAGIFTSVTPPTYNDFKAYGYSAYTGERRGATTVSAAEIGIGLTLALAGASVGTGIIGAGIIGAVLAAKFVPPVAAAVVPFGAAAKKAKAAAIGITIAAGKGGGAGAASFAIVAAGPVIVAILTAVTIVRAIQVFEQAAIESQLQDDLDAALAGTGELDIVEFIPIFADATVPRFEPLPEVRATATADPSPNAPYFDITQEGTTTRSQVITNGSDGATVRAWLSDGWWVIEAVSDPGNDRVLTPYLPIWTAEGDGEQVVAMVDGRLGVVATSGDDPNAAVGDSFSTTAPLRSTPTDASTLVDATFRLAGPLVVDSPSSLAIDEGEEAMFDGVTSAASTVDIRVSGGTTPIALSSPVDAPTGAFSTTRRFTDDGDFVAEYTPVGPTGSGPAVTFPVTVRNVAPTISSTSMTIDGFALGTVDAETGDLVELTVDFADAPGAIEDHTVTVDWGDGTSSSIVGSPDGTNTLTHRYAVSGEQTIDIVVSDGTDTATTTRTLDVINRPRVVGLSIPGSGVEGVPVTVSGQIVGTVLAESGVQITRRGITTTYPVDLLTGEFSIDLVFPDQTFELLDVEAFGESGQLSSSTGLDLVILNAPPFAGDIEINRVPGAGPIFAGEEGELTVNFSDTGVNDTHTIDVDWGDGTTDTLASTRTGVVNRQPPGFHVWSTPGTYTIDVRIDDGDGGVTTSSIDVDILDPLTTTTTTTTTTTAPAATTPVDTTAPTTTEGSTTTTGTAPTTSTTTTIANGSGRTDVTSSGPMTANQIVDVTIESPEIQAGRDYNGVIRSTPIEIGPARATTDGVVTFSGVTLPADWESGQHTVTLIDVTSGAIAVVVSFTVDAQGTVVAAQVDPGTDPTTPPTAAPTPSPTPATPTGSLPSTGRDSAPVMPIAGLILLAGLALTLIAARRRADRGSASSVEQRPPAPATG